jgi:hypothetical protein
MTGTMPSYTIDKWLKSVAQGYLSETSFGHAQDLKESPLLEQGGVLREIYLLDLATFIIGEKLSVDAISALVQLAPDEDTAICFATQTIDEARHLEIFLRRMQSMGVTTKERDRIIKLVTSSAFIKFRDRVMELIDAKDFLGAVVAHNIILEGMAFPLYEYEQAFWRPFDPIMVDLVKFAFYDECRHVSFGEAQVRELTRGNIESHSRIQKLVSELTMVMEEAFRDFIKKLVPVYQLACERHKEVVSDFEIAPGMKMVDTPVSEQIEILLQVIKREHKARLERIGLEYPRYL